MSGTSGKTGTFVATKPSSKRGSNEIQPGAVCATKRPKFAVRDVETKVGREVKLVGGSEKSPSTP